MNQLKINVTTLALGIALSTGAMAQNMSPQGDTPTKDNIAIDYRAPRAPLQIADASAAVGARSVESIESVESVEFAESVALLAAARKKAATVRFDAMYEVAKEQCNTYPIGSRAHCLSQMKTGFGK